MTPKNLGAGLPPLRDQHESERSKAHVGAGLQPGQPIRITKATENNAG